MTTSPAIKICGVTSLADAELAVALGADLLGLNFHPPSPRFLELDDARRIADAVRGRVDLVGVFVNRPLTEVEEIDERVGLDLFQFHGDETAASIAPIAGRAIKAFRVDDDWRASALGPYAACHAFLVEARHPTLYGGAGESWGYERLAAIEFERPVLVAGGIRPDNAREALEESGAWGIDVCSGVESRPGRKDPELLERLFAEFRIANDDRSM